MLSWKRRIRHDCWAVISERIFCCGERRLGTFELKPIPVYYFLTGGQAFLLGMAMMVAIVFQVSEAGLDPLQLILVGTALEATIFLCEMPTGIIADVYSRRASVLIGFAITGVGLVLTGLFAQFETILIGSIIWGLGYTFVSGAHHAWISDEIGVERASRVFVRGAQIELFARIAAIPVAVIIALYDLNLPILIAGVLLVVLALILVPIMPERGFQRGGGRGAGSTSRVTLTATLRSGGALVLASPLLITVFGIALFYGMSSEGFDRLWEAHFLRDLGFPGWPATISLPGLSFEVEPIIWFGAIRMVATVLSLGAAELAHRKLDFTSHRVITRWLFFINIMQMLSIVVIAVAVDFWMGAAAFWLAVVLSRVYDPLYLGWINQNIPSNVRATVLSMSSQADSFGQIVGGPVIGLIGRLIDLRAALLATAGVLVPALLLYLRAFHLGPAEALKEEEPELSTAD